MKKRKTLRKILTTNIRPMKFDASELLLLAFVTVALLTLVSWQLGFLPSIFSNSLILGISTAR